MLMTRQECPLSLPVLLHVQEAGALVNVLLGFLESDTFEPHDSFIQPCSRPPGVACIA